MNLLSTIFPENIINALGWTIFHSLWQGCIIGLILNLIYKIRPNLKPQFKYLLGIFALVAILSSSLFTFLVEYQPGYSLAKTAQLSSTSGTYLSGLSETSIDSSGFDQNLQNWQKFLIRSFDLVTAVWLIGVFLLSIRLAGGMLVINGMRHKRVSPLPAELEKNLALLVARVGLKHSIRFLQSQKIKVPTVMGVMRPVVLIPAMIISGLPADQFETIIVHELAHIRRYDFLVNILQSVIEAVFFYHPVVWIISEHVRQERENCCDDFAVRICGKLNVYAKALAGLSEMQINSALPYVAITGNRKNIVHRVERLINSKKMKTNTTERFTAGLVLMTSALIILFSTGVTLTPSRKTHAQTQIEIPYLGKQDPVKVVEPEPAMEAAPVKEPVTILVPEPFAEPAEFVSVNPVTKPAPGMHADTSHHHSRDNIDIKDNIVTREFHTSEGEDHEMKFIIRQGRVKELYVDGERIPDDKISSYQKKIDVTLEDLGDIEMDLKHAREELDNLDIEAIREDLRLEMEHFKEHDMKELQEEIRHVMEDVEIDHEMMQEEMHKAQEEITKAMENYANGKYELNEEEYNHMMRAMEINLAEASKSMAILEEEDMQKMMDEALESIREIDFETIQMEIEDAMKEVEEIDFAEIEKEMQATMQNMENEKIKIEEMIDELEKLELDKK